MTISGIDSIQSGVNQQSSVQSKDEMGKDEFMKLLVAQLQHQDPLNPMDSTGFTSQLAEFSSLEQLQNVNTNLSNLSAAQMATGNVQAMSFIGKTVMASGSEFEVHDGIATQINFALNSDADAVQIGVYDQVGHLVHTIQAGAMSAGEQSFKWDGLDQNGSFVSNGKYSFEVMAVDSEDQQVGVTTYTRGNVTGVNYNNGSPYLLANQIEIPLSSVISVVETVDVEI